MNILPYKFNKNILGYVDTDSASDLTDSWSTINFILNLRISLIIWLSKKQATIALSTSKVENMGLSTASWESTWLNKLSCDFVLKILKSILIFCGNEENIKIATNLDINPYIKHMIIYHYFTRKKIGKEKNKVDLCIFSRACSQHNYQNFRAWSIQEI